MRGRRGVGGSSPEQLQTSFELKRVANHWRSTSTTFNYIADREFEDAFASVHMSRLCHPLVQALRPSSASELCCPIILLTPKHSAMYLSGGTFPQYPALHRPCFTYPAIDNHAHPLLEAGCGEKTPLVGLVTEADQDFGGIEDAAETVAGMRAARQLGELLHLNLDVDQDEEDAPERVWARLKAYRTSIPYDQLCGRFLAPTEIALVLVDDMLGGVGDEPAEEWEVLGKRVQAVGGVGARRLVRVESLAEDIIMKHVDAHFESLSSQPPGSPAPEPAAFLNAFRVDLRNALENFAADPNVVGFKSIVCYRGGLDVSVDCMDEELLHAYAQAVEECATEEDGISGVIKLENKVVNDYIVRETCEVAALCGKPVQFHVGLGDNDTRLAKASPAHLQPLIEHFGDTTFVLLHAGYPWTREAGYLASVYKNVYLDLGRVFPVLSRSGQEEVIKQTLELAPTNKIMWSTAGRWWPESYYLGSLQAREALYNVLSSFVTSQDLTERQAVSIVRDALFRNANRVYKLGLAPPEQRGGVKQEQQGQYVIEMSFKFDRHGEDLGFRAWLLR